MKMETLVRYGADLLFLAVAFGVVGFLVLGSTAQ
jgi:hypothetical protein